MANPVFPTPFLPGYRLLNGLHVDNLFANPQYSSQSGMTAFSTGGITNAVKVSATISNFATVAAAADSAILPKATAGAVYFVSNNGAFALQMFGNGSDTIDGIAGATGISMPAGQDLIFVCCVAGQWDGYGANDVGVFTALTISGFFTQVPQLIVSAGATQGGATAITSSKAIVTTATASSKGVRLPTASTGLEVEVGNAGPTFGTKVYPATGGKIGAAATNITDTVLAANKVNRYIAVNKTFWIVQRGA